MYLARVSGEITHKKFKVDKAVRCLSKKNCQWGVEEGSQKEIFENGLYVYQVNPKKKESQTEIKNKDVDQLEKKVKRTRAEHKEYKKAKSKKYSKNEYWLNLKPSVTLFEKVFYDVETDTSLLKCFPITGRTHQIRVHLQSIGHPIINDSNYGGRVVGNFLCFDLVFPSLMIDNKI